MRLIPLSLVLLAGCGIVAAKPSPTESRPPPDWSPQEMVRDALPVIAPRLFRHIPEAGYEPLWPPLSDSLSVDSVQILAWQRREIRYPEHPPRRYDRAIVWMRFHRPLDRERWALLHLHRSEGDSEWTWFKSMHGPHPGSATFDHLPTVNDVCAFLALDPEWTRLERTNEGDVLGPRSIVLKQGIPEEAWRAVIGRLPLPGCGVLPPPDTAAWPTSVWRMPVVGYAIVEGRARRADGSPVVGEEVALRCPAGGDWMGRGRTNERGAYRIRSSLPMLYRDDIAGGQPLSCLVRLGAGIATDTIPVLYAASPDSITVTHAPVLTARR